MIFGKYLPPLPLHFGGSIRGLNGCTHLLARLPEVLRFCRTAVPPYLHIQNCCRFCVPPVSCWRLRAGKCGVMNHAPLFLARILPFNMTIQLRLTRSLFPPPASRSSAHSPLSPSRSCFDRSIGAAENRYRCLDIHAGTPTRRGRSYRTARTRLCRRSTTSRGSPVSVVLLHLVSPQLLLLRRALVHSTCRSTCGYHPAVHCTLRCLLLRGVL